MKKTVVSVFILFSAFGKAQTITSDTGVNHSYSFYRNSVQLYVSPDHFLYKNFEDQNWKRELSFSAGVQLCFTITPRWSFSTGINYRQIRFSYHTPENYTSKIHHTFREDYLGIPFNASFIFTNVKSKLRGYVNAGFAFTTMFRKSQRTEQTDVNGNHSTSGYVRTWSDVSPQSFLSSNLGLGAIYTWNERLSLYAEPGFLFSAPVLDRSLSHNIYTRRNTLYCKLGANYSFGKSKTKELQPGKRKTGNKITFLVFGAGGMGGNGGKKVAPVKCVSGVNFQFLSFTNKEIEETPSYYYGAGVNIIFPLGNKFSIKTGIEAEKFRYDGVVLSYDVKHVDYSNASNVVTTYFVQEANAPYYFIERSLLLPVSAIWWFHKGEKTSQGIELGGSIHFTSSHRSGLISSFDPGRIDGYAMGGYLFKLRLAKNLSLFMEPVVKIQPYLAHKGRSLWNAALKIGVMF